MSGASSSGRDIVPFSFEGHQIRVIQRDGQPWFVAADVCAILEIANHRDTVARLDNDERASVTTTTAGGDQVVTAVNESGCYRIVFRSRKQSAKRFTKWITSEVFPSIRRTGAYGAPAAAIDLNDPATLHRLLIDHTGRTMASEERIAELAPKAEALDRLADATGSLCITDAAKALGVRPRLLFSWLEAHRWTYRRTEGGHWVAFQDHISAGRLEHKAMTIRGRGRPDKLIEQVLITPKGLARLAAEKAGA